MIALVEVSMKVLMEIPDDYTVAMFNSRFNEGTFCLENVIDKIHEGMIEDSCRGLCNGKSLIYLRQATYDDKLLYVKAY